MTPPDAGPRPSRRARLAAALAIGAAAGVFRYWVAGGDAVPGDYGVFLRAARALLDGGDPYALPAPDAPPFVYPLPMLVAFLPWGALPAAVGGALFAGLGAAVFAYGVLAWTQDWEQLPPALLGVPALWSIATGQWAPLLVGAALASRALPGLLVVKPTLGAALGATVARPSRSAVGVAAVLLATSVALAPDWPARWLAALRGNPVGTQYGIPAATWLGAPLLLALVRWRRPEARLLAAMACVPQNGFLYDQLPLCLVPRTPREAWALAALTYLAWAGGVAHMAYAAQGRAPLSQAEKSLIGLPYVIALVYVPCLVLVLRRPNAGAVPAWLARAWRWRGHRIGGESEGGPATQ